MVNLTRYGAPKNSRHILDKQLEQKLDEWVYEFEEKTNYELLEIKAFFTFKSKRTLGLCCYSRNSKDVVIGINEIILKDEETLKNTFFHELIHATEDACNDGHGRIFKRIAEYINYKFDLNISRLTRLDKDNVVHQALIEEDKFHILCPHCDLIVAKRSRRCKLTNQTYLYCCSKCRKKGLIVKEL